MMEDEEAVQTTKLHIEVSFSSTLAPFQCRPLPMPLPPHTFYHCMPFAFSFAATQKPFSLTVVASRSPSSSVPLPRYHQVSADERCALKISMEGIEGIEDLQVRTHPYSRIVIPADLSPDLASSRVLSLLLLCGRCGRDWAGPRRGGVRRGGLQRP